MKTKVIRAIPLPVKPRVLKNYPRCQQKRQLAKKALINADMAVKEKDAQS